MEPKIPLWSNDFATFTTLSIHQCFAIPWFFITNSTAHCCMRVTMSVRTGPGSWRGSMSVRKPGAMKDKIYISPDFDEPLPTDLQAAFEGR